MAEKTFGVCLERWVHQIKPTGLFGYISVFKFVECLMLASSKLNLGWKDCGGGGAMVA